MDSDASYLTSYGGSILILGDPKLHVGEECGKDKGIPPTLVNDWSSFPGVQRCRLGERDDEGKHPGTCIVHAEIGALTQGGHCRLGWLQQRRGKE